MLKVLWLLFLIYSVCAQQTRLIHLYSPFEQSQSVYMDPLVLAIHYPYQLIHPITNNITFIQSGQAIQVQPIQNTSDRLFSLITHHPEGIRIMNASRPITITKAEERMLLSCIMLICIIISTVLWHIWE